MLYDGSASYEMLCKTQPNKTFSPGMLDLNTLIPSNGGWVLIYATFVSSYGKISGYGTHNGQMRAFLLVSGGGANNHNLPQKWAPFILRAMACSRHLTSGLP